MMVLLMDEPGFRATLCAAGTVSLLAAVSTVPDVADASPYVKPFLLTVEPPDFELRQLSWSCLAALCDDQGALRTAIESGFLRVLLLWADVAALGKASGDKDPAIGRWMPAQQVRHAAGPCRPISSKAVALRPLVLPGILGILVLQNPRPLWIQHHLR